MINTLEDIETVLTNIPETIRRNRVIHRIKQADLADRAGCSQSMISRIEAGSVDPRYSTIIRIFHAMNEMVQERLEERGASS